MLYKYDILLFLMHVSIFLRLHCEEKRMKPKRKKRLSKKLNIQLGSMHIWIFV